MRAQQIRGHVGKADTFWLLATKVAPDEDFLASEEITNAKFSTSRENLSKYHRVEVALRDAAFDSITHPSVFNLTRYGKTGVFSIRPGLAEVSGEPILTEGSHSAKIYFYETADGPGIWWGDVTFVMEV